MLEFIKDKIEIYFSEILLAFLFLGVFAGVLHLMHKSDAGGQDKDFIVWAESADFLILTTLVNMMTRNQKKEKTEDTQAQPTA